MTPLKTTLFFIYFLAALAAVGAAFSHLWRADKRLAEETKQVSAVRSEAALHPGL